MKYKFEDFAPGIFERSKAVEIDEETQKKIAAFVTKLIEKKATEQHHMVDNNQERKRFTTGLLGEAALEKVLGIPIIDWTIGDFEKYHRPDVPGYAVGIKTVEYGKFPVIFKNNFYAQMICVVDTCNPGLVYVCGLASKVTLNTYQDDSLILDKKLRERGTKTGFYGFDYLKPISGIEDLAMYKKISR